MFPYLPKEQMDGYIDARDHSRPLFACVYNPINLRPLVFSITMFDVVPADHYSKFVTSSFLIMAF